MAMKCVVGLMAVALVCSFCEGENKVFCLDRESGGNDLRGFSDSDTGVVFVGVLRPNWSLSDRCA